MRHVEEKVILAKEDLLAVVVELRHALSAYHNESLIVKTKFALGQHSKVLHHNQLVAIIYPQSVWTTPWFEVLYLHDVHFFFSGAKFGKNIQISLFYFSKNVFFLTKQIKKKKPR